MIFGEKQLSNTRSMLNEQSLSDFRFQLAVAIVLFAIVFGVHVALNNYPRAIGVMPDELRYLDIARSLFEGNGLIIRGEASGFQKILYPIMLFPALIFFDGSSQIQAIGVLSSLYICSSIFPTLVLARSVFRNPAAVFICMVITATMPDMMFSMTFMSESIYIPLSLWLFCLIWRCFQATGSYEIWLSAGAGALCYLLYLCKEIAWVYVIAFSSWYLLALVHRIRTREQVLKALGAYFVVFFGFFLLMKRTLFAGLLNSYSQTSFDVFESSYAVFYGVYATLVNSVHIVVGFAIFPIVFTLLLYHNMPQREKDLAFFCLVSALVSFAVIVFTISIREDVGHVDIRQHLRYLIPLYLPFFMLMVKQVWRGDTCLLHKSSLNTGILSGVMTALCVLVVAFLGNVNLDVSIDNMQFQVIRWLVDKFEPLKAEILNATIQTISAIDLNDGKTPLSISPAILAIKLVIVAYTVIGTLFLTLRNDRLRRICLLGLCSILLVCAVFNSSAAYHYLRKTYEVSPIDIEELQSINCTLQDIASEENVLVVLDDDRTRANKLVDTYIQDPSGRYRYMTLRGFNFAMSILQSGDKETGTYSLEGIEYILINDTQGLEFSLGCVNRISDNGDKDYKNDGSEYNFMLYQIIDWDRFTDEFDVINVSAN